MIAGADIRRVDPGDQCVPFHVAVEGGHNDLVGNLLIGGACPNSRTRFGRTPLHVAAELGNNRVVSTLLGNTSTDIDALDNDGFSPLMLASTSGHRSTVEVLLRAGADTTPRSSHIEDHRGAAFDLAAAQGHVEVVIAFLGNGEDARAVGPHGHTALHMAAQHKHGGEMVNVLLDAGAIVNAKTVGGMTPLHVCAVRGHDENMVALMKRGGNVNATASGEISALHWACLTPAPGVGRVVDLLLRWGASETALDTRSKTPSDRLKSMQREIQSALVLLARAPADRTWRRRCWLVMLRARAEREREARSSSSTMGKTDAGGSGGGSMDAERGTAGRAARRMAAGEGGLRGLVPALLDLESEGVFRTIVCFL
ncbi:unnamed protein product [Ectocarpus fasciculatus]